MIFREIFLILTSPKLIFVNGKSVSVMTNPPYFLGQLKLIYLAVLSANFWCYDFDARTFIFFLDFRYFFSYFWILLEFQHNILFLVVALA